MSTLEPAAQSKPPGGFKLWLSQLQMKHGRKLVIALPYIYALHYYADTLLHNILMIFIRMLITNPIKMITLQLKNFSRTSTKNAKTRLWRWFPAVLRGVALLPAVISG